MMHFSVIIRPDHGTQKAAHKTGAAPGVALENVAKETQKNSYMECGRREDIPDIRVRPDINAKPVECRAILDQRSWILTENVEKF